MNRALCPLFAMVILLGGCPKRQTTPRLVYLPPPPSPPAGVQITETITIEEPAPAEPETAPSEEAAPEESGPSAQASAPRRIKPRPKPTTATDTPPATPPEPSQTEVPALEAGGSREQQAALQSRINNMQGNLRQRITRLRRARLSESERKTLEEADSFLSQSESALKDGDLQRSENLARKADLLIAAVGQNH